MDKARITAAMGTGTYGALIATNPPVEDDDLDLALAFGGAPDPEPAPEPEAKPEPLTVQQAKALGFDDAAIGALREAGLLRETNDGQPWRPETLADVDWVILQHKRLDAEEAALRQQFERRIKAVANRRRWLESYSDDCLAVTRANLDVNPKTGTPKRKYVDLEYGRTKLRTSGGGPKLTDEQAVVNYIRSLPEAERPDQLLDALRVTVTESGDDALVALRYHGDAAKVKVLSTPVRAYLQSLPPVPDPETGEAKPRTIPGVVIEEPSERWGWE